MGSVREVLAVTQRVPGGRRTEQHSLRAAGSHFLPGVSAERPIVTPEGLGGEVTTGQSTVLETMCCNYALATR